MTLDSTPGPSLYEREGSKGSGDLSEREGSRGSGGLYESAGRLKTDEERRMEEPELPWELPWEKPVAHCRDCHMEIYEGERYGVDTDGEALCADCLEEEWDNLTISEKYRMLGYEVEGG